MEEDPDSPTQVVSLELKILLSPFSTCKPSDVPPDGNSGVAHVLRGSKLDLRSEYARLDKIEVVGR